MKLFFDYIVNSLDAEIGYLESSSIELWVIDFKLRNYFTFWNRQKTVGFTRSTSFILFFNIFW